MRISDWSSDVCSSDLKEPTYVEEGVTHFCVTNMPGAVPQTSSQAICAAILPWVNKIAAGGDWRGNPALVRGINVEGGKLVHPRSEEHTSELQSLMRISYAVFCLKKKKYRH